MIACSPSLSPSTLPPGALFDLLAHYARSQPAAIACASRYRMASYRKVWSRIERATARLQGEWQVTPGDVVAYCGQGHPDALVLYLALVRCGALLWPLEHPDGPAVLADHAAGLPLKIVLFDDDDPQPRALATALPLSSLIGGHCPYEARALPFDPAVPSLLGIDADGKISQHSLLQLQEETPSGLQEVHRRLFDQDVLGPVVLPTLAAGKTLVFL
ncbi:AMP-binding protein|uniref:AMP-binding protein n=1 Tax=Noviherbaspirillum sp. L7-7A TaxID=2850560 RepID=UPI001C2C7A98|nr:AMP-binding protein [Noviherbaspirillum sp. L7-7A]MBV0877874.1 AMP-binding protein [Noviherbaspirillum sp. L7-7A]